MDDLYIGAYWKARKETIHACAERLGHFLTALSVCDSVFATWYKLGKSPRQAKRKQIDFNDNQCLLDLLSRGRNRKDIGREVMEELGFHVSLWNGREPPKDVGLSVTCGLYSTVAGLGGNCVVIDLPQDLGDLGQSQHMAKVLISVAKSWEPDWGGVISRKSRNARNFVAGEPFVDWMLYVSRKLAPPPNLPAPSSVLALENSGSLILVQDEPVQPDNSAHLQRVKRVEDALGLLTLNARVRH